MATAPKPKRIAGIACAKGDFCSSCGGTMTDFIDDAISVAAEEALANRTSFALASDKWAAFVVALERPPQSKKRLAKLLSNKSVLE